MSNDGKIYLNSGARNFKLPSGDSGVYIDLCIEDLQKILEQHRAEEVKRPWVSKRENRAFNNIRIFAIPKKKVDDKTLYPYYLEVAKVNIDK